MSRTMLGVFFAVLWVAGMTWWNWPMDIVEFVILAVCGVIAGALFAWIMDWFQKRYLRRV